MIKETIMSFVRNRLYQAFKKANIIIPQKNIQIFYNTRFEHGHFSSNALLKYQKQINLSDQQIVIVINNLNRSHCFEKAVLHPSKFINIWLSNQYVAKLLNKYYNDDFQINLNKKNQKYSFDVVSANPTGYMHLGHARHAVVAEIIINICKWSFINFEAINYVNDYGNQIDLLAISIFAKYLEILGDASSNLFKNYSLYKNREIKLIAATIIDNHGDKYKNIRVLNGKLENQTTHVFFKKCGLTYFLSEYKKDLSKFNLDKINFVYESKITKFLPTILKKLQSQTYPDNGAILLSTKKHHDDKDRVLIKSNSNPSYFANDIVNHYFRSQRANYLIDLFGADHHGYQGRLTAAMHMLNPKTHFSIKFLQLVKLIENKKELKLSKRSGVVVYTRDLIKLIGIEKLKFFMISQQLSSSIKINISKINLNSKDNIYFYCQYMYARCCSLIKKIPHTSFNQFKKTSNFSRQDTILSIQILLFLDRVKEAINEFEPNVIYNYLVELSQHFSQFYHQPNFLKLNEEKRDVKINMVFVYKKLIEIIYSKIFKIKLHKKM